MVTFVWHETTNDYEATVLLIEVLWILHFHYYRSSLTQSGPRGVMVKAMYSKIGVSEFELQSRYYVRANTFGKGMKLLILHAMG